MIGLSVVACIASWEVVAHEIVPLHISTFGFIGLPWSSSGAVMENADNTDAMMA